MRVLFATWAWPSHHFPMVPLAWALRSAGHEVWVAGPPALTKTITESGLPAVPVGHDVDAVAAVREFVLRPQPDPAAPAEGGQPQAGPGSRAPAGPKGPRALTMFAELADAMADDLVTVAKAWHPDLVVYETTCWAGPLAASAAGVPAVRHLYGPDLLYRGRELIPGYLTGMRERLGLGPVNPFGDVTIDPCPPAMRMPADYRRQPIRYVPYNGPGTVPRWLLDPPERPRVCVTWGTTMARLSPDLFIAGEMVSAIQDLDVEVVASITPGQRELIGPVPAGTLVAESVPIHLLLPSCGVVIAHGGAGTLMTAMASGVPQLLIPQLPDHLAQSQRLGQTGAGIVLRRGDAGPAQIRRHVSDVLLGPGYRAAARRLQEENLQQPAPRQVVGALERLAREGAAPPDPSTASGHHNHTVRPHDLVR
jgi:UDP:flavonoid glycosyltransferase YjiC (YdhE family)